MFSCLCRGDWRLEKKRQWDSCVRQGLIYCATRQNCVTSFPRYKMWDSILRPNLHPKRLSHKQLVDVSGCLRVWVTPESNGTASKSCHRIPSTLMARVSICLLSTLIFYESLPAKVWLFWPYRKRSPYIFIMSPISVASMAARFLELALTTTSSLQQWLFMQRGDSQLFGQA